MKNNSFMPVYITVVVIFLLSTVLSLYSIGKEGQSNDKRVNILLASRIYDVINNSLSKSIIVSNTMSNNVFLLNDLKNEQNTSDKVFETNIRNYLSHIRDDMGFATAFVISDRSKKYFTNKGLHSVMDVENAPKNAWYPKFLEKNKEYDLNVNVAKHNNNAWTIFVNTRMEDEAGNLLGVCGVSLSMADVQNTLLSFCRNYNVNINLVNPDGLVMVAVHDNEIKSEIINIPENVLKDTNDFQYEKGERGHFKIYKYIDDIDWYLVVASDDTDDDYRGAFFSTIVTHIVLCIIMLILVFRAMNWAAKNTRKLHEESVIDKPTGLYNKRAFEDLKEHLKAGKKVPPNFMVMTADLNGLKRANDNLGHEAGDELIAGGASVLKSAIESYGVTYRTGGDEFMAILRMSPKELDDLIKDLEEKTAAWRGEKVQNLSISYGFASSEENPDLDIDELIKLSDERMYKNKEEHYKKTGEKRRT